MYAELVGVDRCEPDNSSANGYLNKRGPLNPNRVTRGHPGTDCMVEDSRCRPSPKGSKVPFVPAGSLVLELDSLSEIFRKLEAHQRAVSDAEKALRKSQLTPAHLQRIADLLDWLFQKANWFCKDRVVISEPDHSLRSSLWGDKVLEWGDKKVRPNKHVDWGLIIDNLDLQMGSRLVNLQSPRVSFPSHPVYALERAFRLPVEVAVRTLSGDAITPGTLELPVTFLDQAPYSLRQGMHGLASDRPTRIGEWLRLREDEHLTIKDVVGEALIQAMAPLKRLRMQILGEMIREDYGVSDTHKEGAYLYDGCWGIGQYNYMDTMISWTSCLRDVTVHYTEGEFDLGKRIFVDVESYPFSIYPAILQFHFHQMWNATEIEMHVRGVKPDWEPRARQEPPPRAPWEGISFVRQSPPIGADSWDHVHARDFGYVHGDEVGPHTEGSVGEFFLGGSLLRACSGGDIPDLLVTSSRHFDFIDVSTGRVSALRLRFRSVADLERVEKMLTDARDILLSAQKREELTKIAVQRMPEFKSTHRVLLSDPRSWRVVLDQGPDSRPLGLKDKFFDTVPLVLSEAYLGRASG